MTNKTISTKVNGYKFATSNTNLTITATGTVTGNGDFGLAAIYGVASRAGESILNLGVVTSANQNYGIVLKDGGTITNGSATDKTASISGGQNIAIKISGRPGIITNLGTIHAATNGILLNKGGTVTNGSAGDFTASISSTEYAAIGISYGAGLVTNFGTIKGEVDLEAGGSVTNQATGKIIDPSGVNLSSGTVTNLGTITGQVKLGSGQVVNGSKTNHAATIGAANYGVYVGKGTLTNFGVISAKSAVAMQYGTVMIAEVGSKVIGAAYGQGATLVFGAAGGAGTISGLGTGAITGSTAENFKDLSKYEIQAGGNWTLSGTKNTLKATESLTVDGTLLLAGSLDGSGKVSIAKTGTIRATATAAVEIQTAVANAGLLVAAGGTLELDKAVTGDGAAHISSGTLFAAGAFSENVQFTGTTGTLELAHGQTFTGKISGFAKTGAESLDLKDIAFGAKTKATFSGTAAGGTLTVTDGTHTAKIGLLGNYVGNTFKAATDGAGGTKIIDQTTKAATSQFVSAMAGMGGASGGTLSPRHEATAPTTTLLAHPRE